MGRPSNSLANRAGLWHIRSMPRIILTLLALLALLPKSIAAQPPRLKVSENHRELVTTAGQPFIYLGDTAWELFHRLDRADADLYLADRAKKGFNVIQAVALAEINGLTEPNAYGDLPLKDNDPTRPNEAYFKHVDYIVNQAARLGMFTGLLPTWGDKVNKKWGAGPEIFTPENARIYGEWIGRRYQDKPIIWILGGDRPIENERHRLVFRAMAEGIRAAVGDSQLITYHPSGGSSSSSYVQGETWPDFNMMQSGHEARNTANYRMIAEDLAMKPTRPTFDGEPAYEDHPVRGDKSHTQWFDQWDVRKLCYWGLFAGACGHTYGTHNIWAMWDGKGQKPADQRTPWKEALKLPGSAQVGFAKHLLESRPLLGRIGDPSLLTSGTGDGAEHCQALRAADGAWAMVYSASGKAFTVDTSKLTGRQLKSWWWDPRSGQSSPGPAVARTGKPETFRPPSTGDGQDWVLVLDDAAKKFARP
jgi:hypothetical protein